MIFDVVDLRLTNYRNAREFIKAGRLVTVQALSGRQNLKFLCDGVTYSMPLAFKNSCFYRKPSALGSATNRFN
jgi:hypothetical protein